ncbi:MAG: DUF1963 domain-containing protein [Bacteroidota bacterium]
MSAPHVRIGTLAFDLDHATCTVPSYASGSLQLEVGVRATRPKTARRAGLLSEYHRKGLLTFHLGARGVYGPGGVPEGRFEIRNSRAGDIRVQFRTEGDDYRLEFNGEVAFADGRASIHGTFGEPFLVNRPSFEVEIDVPLDLETIDWGGYVFGSLDEIAHAPPDLIQSLTLNAPEFETLPPEILRLGALTSLTIVNHNAYGSALPLRDLTPEIGRLGGLTRLAINGAALDTLPDEIGHLENLEMLTVGMCQLEAVPEAVWRLPRLAHLSLPGNRLAALPEAMDLPALKSLDLSRNQLTTVPASLADLPALDRLALKGNPLEALPEAIRSVSWLDLSIAERQRLLPRPFPGAEAGYPEAAYRLDDRRIAQLDAILDETPDLDPRVRPFLLATARPAIGFRRTESPPDDRLGATRFGGMPDLPANWEYPRFTSGYHDGKETVYEFIAQLDCEALAPLQDYLPRTGVLYVFLSTLHDLYGDKLDYPTIVVRHYDGPPEALASGDRFQFDRDDYFEMVGPAYERMDVTAEPIVSLPPSYPLRQNAYHFRAALPGPEAERDAFIEAYQGVDENVEANEPDHEAGGYGFSQHELPETEVALAVGGDPADWLTLLTVRSRGGMQWGDAGDLYVVIHKADLARGDVSRVEATMYSS